MVFYTKFNKQMTFFELLFSSLLLLFPTVVVAFLPGGVLAAIVVLGAGFLLLLRSFHKLVS